MVHAGGVTQGVAPVQPSPLQELGHRGLAAHLRTPEIGQPLGQVRDAGHQARRPESVVVECVFPVGVFQAGSLGVGMGPVGGQLLVIVMDEGVFHLQGPEHLPLHPRPEG